MQRNLWKLINEQPVNVTTQKTGTLNNGYTVSGYNALSDDILRAEGWKPLIIDIPPEQVEDIEYEQYYEETTTEIIQHWRIKN